MSRCTCCNAVLTPFEATRKHALTKQYMDICSFCFKEAFQGTVPTIDRLDLLHISDIEVEDTYKEEDNI